MGQTFFFSFFNSCICPHDAGHYYFLFRGWGLKLRDTWHHAAGEGNSLLFSPRANPWKVQWIPAPSPPWLTLSSTPHPHPHPWSLQRLALSASCGCCTRSPHMGGLRQHTFILSVWEAEFRNQCPCTQIKMVTGLCSHQGLHGRTSPLPLPALLAFLGLWSHRSDLCLCGPLTFASLCVCPIALLPSYKDTLKAHLDHPRKSPHLRLFSLLLSAEIILPYKETSLGSGDRDTDRALGTMISAGPLPHPLWFSRDCPPFGLWLTGTGFLVLLAPSRSGRWAGRRKGEVVACGRPHKEAPGSPLCLGFIKWL